VRGQHDDRGSGQFLADHPGCLQALGGLRGRHPDVDDRQFRAGRTDQGEQFCPVPGLAGDVEPGTVEQAGQALPQQDVVIGQHHLDRAPDPRCRPGYR
jgi:hypothetical protein